MIESLMSSRELFGRRELYAVETETETSTGEWLSLIARRRGYYGKVEGWRPAEIVERRHVRADDPIGNRRGPRRAGEAGRAAESGRLGTETSNTETPLAATARPLRRIRPSLLHTVESGVSAGERGDRLDLGVRVWHYGGWLDGWQPTAIVHGVSIPADDGVALGEARAKLQVLAEQINEDVLLAAAPAEAKGRTGRR